MKIRNVFFQGITIIIADTVRHTMWEESTGSLEGLLGDKET